MVDRLVGRLGLETLELEEGQGAFEGRQGLSPYHEGNSLFSHGIEASPLSCVLDRTPITDRSPMTRPVFQGPIGNDRRVEARSCSQS